MLGHIAPLLQNKKRFSICPIHVFYMKSDEVHTTFKIVGDNWTLRKRPDESEPQLKGITISSDSASSAIAVELLANKRHI